MERGMSLIELLVYIAIVSIVVVVLSATYISFLNARAKTEAVAITDTALRYVAETLTRDVERATSIVTPASGVVGTSTLLMHGSSTIAYALLDGALTRTVDGVAETLTSDRVVVTQFALTHTENTQEVTGSTFDGLRWQLQAEHAYGANEYRYDAARHGAASRRSFE
ncbi:hypothetical protein A3C89_03310 [Candidatus Kaiserbacteria bacterium RIFCSPHIGHO2_02_FULL_50_50]|uniref:Prepilin-type N-terminal cleavage/methylation domain-containing protein n=1 Tax=Candidatus Kaiserbacteria bacterium RIFCSPHIGHO2_02_FULL_50_50 TaxID=1798492 RepID=A0A1F6DG03_9BACT|nr:MAG: hypothetical protein A3C89_03310 [Candidatus Kaiserbacteria bacterium RIFCSPHIGHO2_02_FULL_50_50]OGG89243.1 MAG: hypothetical protein A3G62_01310 [Candidatus Kaiserbacteria bacterium RIFCSPLOWO2_12_FULL_50_10]